MAYNPFRHFWLKAVSVGIAVLLWMAVGGEKIVERSLRAPLELQNESEALEIVGDVPSAVDVRVRGSASALGRLVPGDVVAVLDDTLPGVRVTATASVEGKTGVEMEALTAVTVAWDAGSASAPG